MFHISSSVSGETFLVYLLPPLSPSLVIKKEYNGINANGKEMSSSYYDPKKDIYISLYFKVLSTNSLNIIDELVSSLLLLEIATRKNNLVKALAPICVGLLRAINKGGPCSAYRPMATAEFTGMPVGHGPFKSAIDGLVSLGFVTVKEGCKPAVPSPEQPATTNRYKATSKFIALIERHGIKPDEWDRHFEPLPRPVVVKKPVVLRTGAPWVATTTGRKVKRPNSTMTFSPFDPFPITEGLRINEINAFLAAQDIQPAHQLTGFQRIFSDGDVPGFNWDKGGRLYNIGGGYQQEKSAKRLAMTINGEAVVEIDIRASHLTILHALKKIPMPAGDPYGGTAYPRGIVKSWVAAALGHERLPGNKWSPAAKKAYAKKQCGIRARGGAFEAFCKSTCKARCLQKFYPLAKVGPKIAAHFPILDDWETSPWRWGDFQFIESEAVIGAVHELATVYGIPALPVHDSIIVPRSKQAIAVQVLSDMFQKHVGVRPVLTIK